MDAKLLELLRPFARLVAEEITAMQQLQQPATQAARPSRQLKGITGIMAIFQCSRSKANEMRASGELDAAITPYGGRSFLIDEQKALAIKEKKQGGRRCAR